MGFLEDEQPLRSDELVDDLAGLRVEARAVVDGQVVARHRRGELEHLHATRGLAVERGDLERVLDERLAAETLAGVGEGIDDLQPFVAREFVEALFA